MHFVILLYGDEQLERQLGPEALREIMEEHRRFADRLRDGGKLVMGEPLEASEGAKVVRDGIVTDGPFAETREQLGGFYVIDCEDVDEACRWAKEVPRSPGLVVEVRKIATHAA
jgi:hypothetical protein